MFINVTYLPTKMLYISAQHRELFIHGAQRLDRARRLGKEQWLIMAATAALGNGRVRGSEGCKVFGCWAALINSCCSSPPAVVCESAMEELAECDRRTSNSGMLERF